MFIHDYMKVNSKGHLEIGGCDAIELCQKYSTPLMVMDEERIISNMRAYKNAVDKYYDSNATILYASKAFSSLYIYDLAKKEGLGVDVVSGGELYTALKAGFDAGKIVFHGNNKSYDELKMAIRENVGRIVVDSNLELGIINEISSELNKKTNILIRVKPGVDAHTHKFISTGQIDSKFGFSIENGEAFEFIKEAVKCENICLKGLHCHIGSQIFLFEPFECTAKVMMNFYAKLKNELGVELDELNLGGGFGIKYTKDDKPVNYDEYIKAVSSVLKDICKKENLKLPYIYMEPGRSIVGDAGTTLYTVGAIKDIKDIRTYVSVDGGMADNPRYILYSAEYDAVLANRANENEEQTVTICGKCCESGDIIIENCDLPTPHTNDILAVMSTGAYNYSMASNYNRIPRPCVIAVNNGKDKVIIKRETYEDLIKNDIL